MAVVDVDYTDTLKRYYSDASNVRLVNTVPHLIGETLDIVRYDHENRKDIEVYFLKAPNGERQIFNTVSELAEFIAAKKEKLAFYQYLVSVIGISGIIALAITGVIIYMLVNGGINTQIPTVLSSSLSVILGFYFGSAGKATPGSPL